MHSTRRDFHLFQYLCGALDSAEAFTLTSLFWGDGLSPLVFDCWGNGTNYDTYRQRQKKKDSQDDSKAQKLTDSTKSKSDLALVRWCKITILYLNPITRHDCSFFLRLWESFPISVVPETGLGLLVLINFSRRSLAWRFVDGVSRYIWVNWGRRMEKIN